METQTVYALLTRWLDWTGHPGEKLLAAFRAPDFMESNPNLPITRSAFPDPFDATLQLQKVTLLVERFECTPQQVGWLFTYASAAGWPDLATLPVTWQPAPTAPLEAWLQLIETFALRDRLPRGPELLDDLLRKAAVDDASDATAARDAAKADYRAALVQWTAWSQGDLDTMLGTADDHTQQGLLAAEYPQDYLGTRLLKHLMDCFSLLQRLGMSAAQCRDLISNDVDQSKSEMVKQAVRAKFEEAQWLELARPLRDALREQQRQALVAYLLVHPDNDHRWRDSNDIYSYFLIDIEMDPCMLTSRIKQALSSVQFFVQRCLMNLEANVLASAELDDRWRDWRWMKNYRVWEANRKIFLYPENWIEPELRDDKTPFFLELESELLQNDLTHETAENAFRSYLQKLDEVARLEIVGMYHQQEKNPADQQIINILHVFGRTQGLPHIYYYRQLIDNDYWTPWERVDLDIEGDHLVPVVWQGQLYLIWPIFTELPRETADPDISSSYWEIQLARSTYESGTWSPKRVSESFVSTWSRNLGEDSSKLIFKGFSYPDRLEVKIIDVEIASPGLTQQRETSTRSAGNLSPIRERFNRASVFFSAFGGPSDPPGDGLRDRIGGTFNADLEDTRAEPTDLWWQYYFRLNGCNSDFVVIREPLVRLTDIPQELVPAHMWLQPANSAKDQLYLPKTTSQAGIALERLPDASSRLSPAASVRILYPHQEAGFSGLRTGPWFFNADQRSYFVTVRQPARIFGWDEDLVEPVGATREFRFAPAPDDPFDPFNGNGRLTPLLNPGDPLLFAETTPVTPASLAVSGNLPLPETRFETGRLRTAASSSLLVAREHLETVSMNAMGPLRLIGNYRYTFHSFYHPYLCTLIEALNRNGVDALLQRPQQFRSDADDIVFVKEYQPKAGTDQLITSDYPAEKIDFDLPGPYSQYNWELFFHAPFLIANRLRQNQRFAEAQRWLHYIFDPTDTSGLDSPQRYWRTKPFHIKSKLDYQRQQIPLLLRLLASGGDADKLSGLDADLKAALLADYADLITAVKLWRADPFKPHLIARLRTTAYQKTVVMKYIDNLIAWGDQLFRRDTIEALNEATQLYILAADLLGKRPEEMPPRAVPVVQTYNTLAPLLGEFSSGLAEIEEFVPPSVASVPVEGDTPLPSPLTMLYFCVPKNDELLAYWDLVADRLFKIRHCMNIEGVVRQLPLFASPIDPALLVRAAAAGIDLSSVLNDIHAPLPHYRFNILGQKASELCNELKSLGGMLLATLEKRD
ncbi:MAG: hypothetical protein JSV42_13445, partial [Chloroflexota bacterium]